MLTDKTNEFAPHQKSKLSTNEMLFHIVIAILPIFVVAINMFKMSAINNFIICFCSCLIFEIIVDILQNKKSEIGEFAPFVTALLLGFCMPQNAPAWICVLASFIAIVVINKIVYQLLGHAVNSVCTTLLICVLFFEKSIPFSKNIAGASAESYSLLQLLIGDKSGVVLQACAIAILIGIVYLCVMRVVDYKIPLMALGFTFIFMVLFTGFNFTLALKNMLFGNILFVSTFLACDFKSQPQSLIGKVIYCFTFALFTALLRLFSDFSEGAYLALFIANLVVMLTEDEIIKKKYKKTIK